MKVLWFSENGHGGVCRCCGLGTAHGPRRMVWPSHPGQTGCYSARLWRMQDIIRACWPAACYAAGVPVLFCCVDVRFVLQNFQAVESFLVVSY